MRSCASGSSHGITLDSRRAKTMKAITVMPTDMPRMASRCRARFQKMPRKKPPSSAPYVNDAMESAITTTGVCWFSGKSSAPPVSTTPQISANVLPTFSVRGSSALRPVSGR